MTRDRPGKKETSNFPVNLEHHKDLLNTLKSYTNRDFSSFTLGGGKYNLSGVRDYSPWIWYFQGISGEVCGRGSGRENK